MSLIDRYTERQKRLRAFSEARILIKEAQRGLRKFSHRITREHAAEIRTASENLSRIVADRDFTQLPDALNLLDKRLEDYLSFGRKSTAREYTEQIAVAVLIALFLRAFVVEAFKIPSGSMIPTLQVGDHIFVNKFIYGIRVPFTGIKLGANFHKPKRGEVIVFIYPIEPDKDFIKRVVAVEGDTLEVKHNTLYVNGQAVEKEPSTTPCEYQDYEEGPDSWEDKRCQGAYETVFGNRYLTIYSADGGPDSTRTYGPKVVPPGQLFVMGDNRDNSSDSRFWGTVPLENVRGKAMVIWWSIGKIGPGATGLYDGIRFNRMFKLVH